MCDYCNYGFKVATETIPELADWQEDSADTYFSRTFSRTVLVTCPKCGSVSRFFVYKQIPMPRGGVSLFT